MDELKAAISEMHDVQHQVLPSNSQTNGEHARTELANGLGSGGAERSTVDCNRLADACASVGVGDSRSEGADLAPRESKGQGPAGQASSSIDSATSTSPEWYIKVLAPRLVLIRLQLQMLEPSTHALMKRLLFSPRRATASFWAYMHTEDDVSLIIDEVSLHSSTIRTEGSVEMGCSLGHWTFVEIWCAREKREALREPRILPFLDRVSSALILLIPIPCTQKRSACFHLPA